MHRMASPTRVLDVSTGPLDGIRVIEVGTLISGPFAGRLLGDMGAEVIKIEPPGAPDPLRTWGQAELDGHHFFWTVHARNKKAVTLNLRETAGRDLFLDLVERSRHHRRELPAGHAGEVGARLRRARRPQQGHHPGQGLGLRADRARGAQGRLRVGGRGRERAPAHERFPRWAAATARAVARRQPRGYVRRAGRDGRTVPAHRHRRGPGRRRRVDGILSGRAGVDDPRLRRRRGHPRPFRHPARGHRTIEHLPQRRRQLGGDRRQPGHGVPAVVRGDGTTRAGRRRPVRQSRCARTQSGRAGQDHRRLGGATRPRRHHLHPVAGGGDQRADQHGGRGGGRSPAAVARDDRRPLGRADRAQRQGTRCGAGAFGDRPAPSATPVRPGRASTTTRYTAGCSAGPTPRWPR